MLRKPFSKRNLARRLEPFGCRCRMCQCEINGRFGFEWDHHITLAIGARMSFTISNRSACAVIA